MSRAVDINTGKEVRAIAAAGMGPFRCSGCGVSVEYVRGYIVHGEDALLSREVSPFFRLRKGPGYQHEDDCQYQPEKQVETLVASAEAVEDSEKPFEKQASANGWIFRLNIPSQQDRKLRSEDSDWQDTDRNTRTERIWSGRRLESYFRSAVGLARLWRELDGPEGRAELRKLVHIKWASKKIPWEKFCFGPETIEDVANLLEQKLIRYPVALLLHVPRYRRQGDVPSRLRFTQMKIASSGLDDIRVSVSAYGDAGLVSLFQQGEYYIVFGDFWYMGTSDWRPSDGRITYRNIGVKLYQSAQLAKIDVLASA